MDRVCTMKLVLCTANLQFCAQLLSFICISAILNFVPASGGSSLKDLQACLTKQGVSWAKSKLADRDDPNYVHYNYQFNLLEEQIYPLAYFLPRNAKEISAAVICCRELKIRLVPKGGGHSYEKYSFGDSRSVVVDSRYLNQLQIDKKAGISIVDSGVLLGFLSVSIFEQGFMTAHGTCPTVGISGLALGGGYGHLSRYYGLTSDNVLEMEVVTAKGSVITVSDKKSSDLYWALRGGGSIGSFGIVTKFKIKIYKLPARIVWGTRTYPISQFQDMFRAYQTYLGPYLSSTINIKLTTIKEKVIVEVYEVQERAVQGKINQVEEIMGKFPKSPEKDKLEFLSYEGFLLKTLHLDVFGGKVKNLQDVKNYVTRESWPINHFKAKSFFVNRIAQRSEVKRIHKMLQEIPSTLKDHIIIEIYTFGGAINKYKPEDTSFVHRGRNLYLVQAMYTNNADIRSTALDQQGVDWLNMFYKETKILLRHQETYQNYVDDDLNSPLKRYYAGNLRRLIAIKHKYDPDNFFRQPQSIPPI